MIDVLICSVPSGIINRPPAAPALLKACVVDAGYTAKTIDFSLNLYVNHCNSDYQLYRKVNRLFEPLVQWESNDVVDNWIIDCVSIVKDFDPRFLAISVFSTFQHRATLLLCQEIKNKFPNIKIILGGYGLPEPYSNSLKNYKQLSAKDKISRFDDYVKQNQLADHFVYGEGEQQLIDIISGVVQSTKPVELNDVPFSNFDDYHLDKYLWHTEAVLLVTGSKGCVRACTFCNIPIKFGKYRRKTGQRIAEEMIELSQKYDVYKFEFTDSLVNGSLKEFEAFVKILAEHNATTKKPITWYGQYICRPQNQVSKEIYKLIKQSGAIHLIIGAESGSDDVLEAMNKKMSVKDIFDELDQFEQHGIQAQLLMLSGFYNETWQRFTETIKFIARCHRYLAAGVISRIAVGMPLIIEPNGYLHLHASELGIEIDKHNNSNWKIDNDPTNTWLERIHRRLIIQSVLQSMNVSMTGNGILELQSMLEQLKIYEQQLRSPDTPIDSGLLESGAH